MLWHLSFLVMELRQLEYLVTVADQASFTHAAEKLHVSQPGVSAQVRQLERELGQELLDRSGRTVRLTQAGSVVVIHARQALAAVASAREAVDELAGLVRGRVTVGMVVACSSLDLFDLLATFNADHPDVEISLAEENSDHLVEGLRSGRLDLAFVGLAATTPPEIALSVVADESFVAAVRRDHPLARRRSIRLAELQDRPLIVMPQGTGLRTALDEGFAAVRLRPRIALEASNLSVVAGLAVRGLGVAILPESAAAAWAADLHAVAITRPRLRGRLALAWRAEGPLTPAARALIDRARQIGDVSAPLPQDYGHPNRRRRSARPSTSASR